MHEIHKDFDQKPYNPVSRRDALKVLRLIAGGVGLSVVGNELLKLLGSEPDTIDDFSFEEEPITSSSTEGFNSNELDNIQIEKPREPESAPSSQVIEGYSIHDGTIELSNSAHPTRWVFALNSRTAINTRLAYPHAYESNAQVESIFHPSDPNLVTYLEENGSPVVWGHSSYYDQKPLTMTDLGMAADFPQEVGLNTNPGNEFLRQELIGSKVYLFQTNDESSFRGNFPGDLSHPSDFDGNHTEAEIVAAVRIPRFFTDYDGNLVLAHEGKAMDLIAQVYSAHTQDVWAWLKDSYPDQGFADLDPKEVIGLKICSFRHDHEIHPGNVPISQRPLTDVKYDQLQSAVYGRYIIAMRPTDNFKKKIDIPSLV